MSLTGIGQALSTNYEMFVTFAFLNAIGIAGIFPLAFVLGLEMVGKKSVAWLEWSATISTQSASQC